MIRGGVDQLQEDDTNGMAACPLAIQEELNELRPPQEDNVMCLHAARLGLSHPVSGEDMQWEVAPSF